MLPLCLSVSKTFPLLILGLSIPRRVNLLEDGCLPIPGCWGVAFLLRHHCDHLTQVYIAFMASIFLDWWKSHPVFSCVWSVAFNIRFTLGEKNVIGRKEKLYRTVFTFSPFSPPATTPTGSEPQVDPQAAANAAQVRNSPKVLSNISIYDHCRCLSTVTMGQLISTIRMSSCPVS